MVAEEPGVTLRHTRRLRAEYLRTGRSARAASRRPGAALTGNLDSNESPRSQAEGVIRTAMILRKGERDISRHRACKTMKSKSPVEDSPAKARQRKRVMYERIYSNAMRHTDWHAIKGPRMQEVNLIPYLDDASRRIAGAALFGEATSENAVAALRRALSGFGAPATILSENGSCFIGRGARKRQAGSRAPALFENELPDLEMGLINSRPYRPRTNGELERFRRLEAEIWNYADTNDHIRCHSTVRPHFPPGAYSYKTPLIAFRSKKATDEARRDDPDRMEADVNE